MMYFFIFGFDFNTSFKTQDLNLFFGGVNAVSKNEAVSDPRRGGFSIEC